MAQIVLIMVTILGLKVSLVWPRVKQRAVYSYSGLFWPCEVSNHRSMVTVTFLHALK